MNKHMKQILCPYVAYNDFNIQRCLILFHWLSFWCFREVSEWTVLLHIYFAQWFIVILILLSIYSLYTSIQPVHQYTTRTPVYSPYTSIQPVHQYTARTPVYSPYTSIQPVHRYTACTPVYSLYTGILAVYRYTACTPVYHLYTSIPPVHQYTAHTPAYNPYTSIQPVHQYTACTPVYWLYTGIQPLRGYTDVDIDIDIDILFYVDPFSLRLLFKGPMNHRVQQSQQSHLRSLILSLSLY